MLTASMGLWAMLALVTHRQPADFSLRRWRSEGSRPGRWRSWSWAGGMALGNRQRVLAAADDPLARHFLNTVNPEDRAHRHCHPSPWALLFAARIFWRSGGADLGRFWRESLLNRNIADVATSGNRKSAGRDRALARYRVLVIVLVRRPGSIRRRAGSSSTGRGRMWVHSGRELNAPDLIPSSVTNLRFGRHNNRRGEQWRAIWTYFARVHAGELPLPPWQFTLSATTFRNGGITMRWRFLQCRTGV